MAPHTNLVSTLQFMSKITQKHVSHISYVIPSVIMVPGDMIWPWPGILHDILGTALCTWNLKMCPEWTTPVNSARGLQHQSVATSHGISPLIEIYVTVGQRPNESLGCSESNDTRFNLFGSYLDPSSSGQSKQYSDLRIYCFSQIAFELRMIAK